MSKATKVQQAAWTNWQPPEPMTSTPSFAKTCVKTPVPIEVLVDILRRPRFADTDGEQYVIDKYLMAIDDARMDDYGNIIVDRRVNDVSDRTMFSCHTDTVHKRSAKNTPYKLVAKDGWLSVKGGGVLGADCGTGIWIMLNLIEAGVPGLYVFHREEEIGGGGSLHIAGKTPELVKNIDHCIAFDRKSTSHIITHQGGERCCSQEFADSFAGLLNLGSGFAFRDNDGGSFTDSKNYTHLIPECTNLSVGYYDQHSQDECQDVSFVTRLVNKLISIDFSQLVVARDPKEEPESIWDYPGWNNTLGRRAMAYVPDDTPKAPKVTDTFDWMLKIVEAFPGEVADLLMEAGWRADELMEHFEDTYNCDPRDL